MHRRVMAALGAATLAASVIAAGTMSADAATTTSPATTSTPAQPSIQRMTGHGPSVSPNHPWTITYRDGSGHITRVWHGTKAQADVLSARWQATQAAHPARAAGASPDIVHAASCSDPTSYWVFRHWTMDCYAFNGSMAVYITGVYEVDSGNNHGYYRIGGTNYHLEHYNTDLYTPGQTVVFINIEGR